MLWNGATNFLTNPTAFWSGFSNDASLFALLFCSSIFLDCSDFFFLVYFVLVILFISASSASLISLTSFEDSSWVVDSGCGIIALDVR